MVAQRAGVKFSLAVFPQSSIFLQPSDAARNDPARKPHLKGV